MLFQKYFAKARGGLGPCGNGWCIYVANTGGNSESREWNDLGLGPEMRFLNCGGRKTPRSEVEQESGR